MSRERKALTVADLSFPIWLTLTSWRSQSIVAFAVYASQTGHFTGSLGSWIVCFTDNSRISSSLIVPFLPFRVFIMQTLACALFPQRFESIWFSHNRRMRERDLLWHCGPLRSEGHLHLYPTATLFIRLTAQLPALHGFGEQWDFPFTTSQEQRECATESGKRAAFLRKDISLKIARIQTGLCDGKHFFLKKKWKGQLCFVSR